jgi:hypothetical protein
LPVMNILAYLALSSAMKEKSFKTLTPGANVIKLFSSESDDEIKFDKIDNSGQCYKTFYCR